MTSISKSSISATRPILSLKHELRMAHLLSEIFRLSDRDKRRVISFLSDWRPYPEAETRFAFTRQTRFPPRGGTAA